MAHIKVRKCENRLRVMKGKITKKSHEGEQKSLQICGISSSRDFELSRLNLQ